MHIELCMYYNIVTIWFLFLIQLINLPPSAHTITFSTSSTYYSSHYIFSAHTTAAIASSVHILQQPLHLQCTYYSSHCIFSTHTTAAITSSVHTATMYSYVQPILSAHCSQLQPAAAIYNHLHYTFNAHCSYTVAVHKMKTTG